MDSKENQKQTAIHKLNNNKAIEANVGEAQCDVLLKSTTLTLS
jgi:hypothetical protein